MTVHPSHAAKTHIGATPWPRGHVPFMDFDLSTHLHACLKVFDPLPSYDVDVPVPGHPTCMADRQDVQRSKDWVFGASHCRAALICARSDD